LLYIKGFPLNLISGSGFIILFLKQCYANAAIYSKHENTDSVKAGIFQRLCSSITERMIFKFILQYLCVSLFYVTVVSVFGVDYKMNPVTQGFCSTL